MKFQVIMDLRLHEISSKGGTLCFMKTQVKNGDEIT
jgi:hypothetical protein